MGVPKRKTSKSRLRSRKRSHRTEIPALMRCPKCGEFYRPHRVCPACGYYRGRQVITVEVQ
ncbi:MAG: 50S ribosomal protein L32 [Kiritimatiellia bacterium]